MKRRVTGGIDQRFDSCGGHRAGSDRLFDDERSRRRPDVTRAVRSPDRQRVRTAREALRDVDSQIFRLIIEQPIRARAELPRAIVDRVRHLRDRREVVVRARGRVVACGYVIERFSITGRVLSIANIVELALEVSARSGEFAAASDEVTRTLYQPSG